RPLSIMSWRFDNLVFGEQWVGHHLHQALWFGLSVGAFIWMCGQVMDLLGAKLRPARRRQALAVLGALFLVHPTHVETAAWISTRHDVMFGTFLCFGLGASARALASLGRPVHFWWVTLSLLCSFLSVQAKETGYAFFPLIFLMVLQMRWRDDLPCWKPALPLLGLSLLCFSLCLVFRSSSGVAEAREWHPEAFSRWLSACGWALDTSLLPLAPRLFYDTPPPPAGGWLAISLVLVWLGVGWKRRKHDGISLFGLAFAGVTLAPTWLVAFQPLMETLVADRYLFLPVGGLLLALTRPFADPRLASRTAIAGVAVIWLMLGGRYAVAWGGSPSSFGAWTVRHAPENVEARIGGIARSLRAGDLDGARALRDYLPAPVVSDEFAHRWVVMDVLLAHAEKDWPRALEKSLALTEVLPRDAARWHDAGAVHWYAFSDMALQSSDGQAPKEYLRVARTCLEQTVSLDERHYRAWYLLGHVAASLGDLEEARKAWSQTALYGLGSHEASESKKFLKQL
ncbi:MAG: hypothetical protein MK213_07700, partial [Planctomycetes bacterium]|nr:hypothetical protein [Planctomycetota bacterium]